MVKHKNSPSEIQQDSPTIQRGLILFNDDVNTFDFVIETLIEVCNHEHEQAEQCAMITHFKGKCNVKTGDFHEVKPMCDEMTSRGLTVSID
jgi:ATP-dependent Clp protease adaptor protein ClpS